MPARRRKPKKSAAWKKLCSGFKRGPKRVKMPTERHPRGYEPLNDPTNIRRVQVTIDGRNICFVIVKSAFEYLNLVAGKTYDMPHDRLTRAGKAFKKRFEGDIHNKCVLKNFEETKLNMVGKCYVMYGMRSKSPDAVLHIQKTIEDQKRDAKMRKRMDQLFNEN